MPPWDVLINETALASVIPDAQGKYRRPIAAALALFLDSMPADHHAAVLAEQLSLPPTATIAERLAALARSCPALHKLGQVLARDRRLSLELRGQLQELESLSPSIPLSTLEAILSKELGPLDRLGVVLDPPALAEASVAVVLPFRHERSTQWADLPQRGVFKILKPGIEDRLEQELERLEEVGAGLDRRCDEFQIPHLDYRDTFEQVRDKLRMEIRLDLEQRHLIEAQTFYTGMPRVQIPVLLPECTPRITAMERLVGVKITEHQLASLTERRRLASLVVSALLGAPLFSTASSALFHGDPHAGNLLYTPDHRLGILDWSLAGTLGERDRTVITQILLAAVTLDAPRLITLLTTLAERVPPDPTALDQVVRARLRRLRHGEFPSFPWLMGLLDEAVQSARLRVHADLMLFRKTLHTLDGVVADLGAGDHRIHLVLQNEWLRHFSREWPLRWIAPPDSRSFATRLSNVDLIQLMLSVPFAATRFWLDHGLDLFDPPQGPS
jgi:ubiquinone biosynthesis protein